MTVVTTNNITPDNLQLMTQFNEEQRYMEQWEEPVYYDKYNLPAFNVEIFPNWLKDFINAVAVTTQTPVDMAGMGALTILSIALAKNYEINPYGDWIEPLNTYCLTLMGPANRKSSVFREMCLPVIQFEKEENERLHLEAQKVESTKRALQRRIDHLEGLYAKDGDDNIFEEIAEAQQELESLPDVYLPTFITDDATPETLVTLMKQNKERIAVISAEAGLFGMVNGRYNGQINLEVYLKGHTGDYLRVDRRGRTECLEAPLITIGIFGQPDAVKNLPPVFHGRGLMARFLYSSPKDFKSFRDVRPKPIPANLRNQYIKNIKLLMQQMTEKPIILKFGNDADALFQAFQESIEIQLRDGGALSEIPEWGGKLVGNIARIAALLHIAKHIEGYLSPATIPVDIDAETVHGATTLSNFFIEHAKASLGKMRITTETEEAVDLLRVIHRKYKKLYDDTGLISSPIPYREIQQAVKSRYDSKQLKFLSNVLEERGFVRLFTDAKSTSKPKQYLMVNPYLLKSSPFSPLP
jgi:replicative DNA helicase